ncbi:MAG: hypothetical protein F6K47_12405 [Symploca sp. SIO2E6]|nr:hypothetical protein [Symploca sp. SIO2E6]
MNSATKNKLRDRYRTIKKILQQQNKKVSLVEDPQEYHKVYRLNKFLCEDTTSAEQTLQNFKYELEKLKQPKNNQIQGIKEFFSEDKWFCLVQNDVEGDSYETIRKTGTWSEYDIVAWLNQLLPVLSDLHRHKISHGNISPENIILVESKKLPVLINFGIEQEIEKYITGETEQQQAANQEISEQFIQDLRDLAVTALILFSGKDSKDLYDANTKQLQWDNIPLLSDNRKEVFSWILEGHPEQDSPTADAISQKLNTALQPETNIVVPPLIWKLLFWGTRGIFILFILGVALVLLKNAIISLYGIINSLLEKPPPPELPKLPDCPSGSDLIAIACDVTVKDIDSFDFEEGKLTIKFTKNGTTDDRLEIYNQTPQNQDSDSDGYSVTDDNKVIGTSTGGIGTTPLEITFNSNANPEAAEKIIHQIVYRNVSSQPSTGTRKVELKLTDGDGGTSNVVNRVISINTPNIAPEIQLPDSQTVDEDNELTFGGITVSDPDANSNGIAVQLQVSNGTIEVQDDIPEGLIFSQIQPNEDGSILLLGPVERINKTLSAKDAITYKSNSDFNGTDTLTVTVDDQGKITTDISNFIWPVGALEPKTDRETLNIEIQAINDKPQLGTGIETEILEPEIPEEPKVELYNSNLIPVGPYNFYESGLGKNVSYVRRDNTMIGALYNAQEPNRFTCFEATIGKYNVDVKWRGNLDLIGRSGESLNRNYSIRDFTVDNSTPVSGLDNADAVRRCQNQ